MNNKPDAIVFFDLDGTLLTSQVDVSQSSLDAIKKLKSNNIMPILATGRTVCEVAHIMKKVAIDSIIAMNGQSVFYQGQHVFSNNINVELIEKIVVFSKEYNIPLAFYNDHIMRVSQNSEQVNKLYAYLKQQAPQVDATIYQYEPIQMLLLLCEQGEEKYSSVFPELTFIRNTPYCVDVFNQGGSKAFGIKKLIENKAFYDVPTYAFGDGYNDVEMFEVVDYPIAMNNGVEKLKQLAQFITDDNDSDGIAKGLKQVGLI